jgi:membrane-associated phospholipid phosphatase
LTHNSTSRFAKIISALFVPPSFTLIVFTYFAFRIETEAIKQIILILTTLTFGFSFHIILFFYLRRKGKLADNEASIKEERTFPFLVSIIFYTIGFIILILSEINIVSTAFWFCYISNTFLIMIINKSWKISAHAMGASGPLAALVYVAGPAALFFSLLILLIGWARINLNLHSIAQVIAGALTGFISTYIQMYVIINFI